MPIVYVHIYAKLHNFIQSQSSAILSATTPCSEFSLFTIHLAWTFTVWW